MIVMKSFPTGWWFLCESTSALSGLFLILYIVCCHLNLHISGSVKHGYTMKMIDFVLDINTLKRIFLKRKN